MSPAHSLLIGLLACAACASSGGAKRHVAAAAPVADPDSFPFVSVELILAEMPAALSDRVFGADEPSGAVRDPGFVRELERMIKGRSDAEILGRSRLLLVNGGKGDISVSSQESTIQDFEVSVAKGIADPIIGTLKEGFWLDANPSVRGDGSTVDLDFSLERSVIRRPIRESEVTLPNTTAEVTIQVPECDSTRTSRQVALRAGQSYVFALEWDDETRPREKRTLAVLTVGIVDAPQGSSPAASKSD